MPTLIVSDLRTGKRKRVEVTASPFTIGRAKGNSLILPDQAVSARHCELEVEGQSVYVMDLFSKSGTILNDRRLKERALLQPEDQVLVGKFRIELQSDDRSGERGKRLLSESEISTHIEEPPEPWQPQTQPDVRPEAQPKLPGDFNRELRRRIHSRLQTHSELVKMDFTTTPPEKIRERTGELIRELLAKELGAGSADEELVRDLLDEALGFGPLEDLLADETVDEIMVNSYDTIFVERRGKIERTDCAFTDVDQVMNILRRILAPIGRRIDESSPMVDARLPDGSRVNAIISPLSLIGPVVTIRKFPVRRFNAQDLIQRDTLTENMAVFLQLAVRYRRNIMISGGTGSGKTTLLNVLSSFIPDEERIVTIEDAAELRLSQTHVIPLEAKPPNIEGKGSIPVRKLLMNALRMRPDRIIIGECRGGEALDMLQAMNTGHDGSLTTLHANAPRDALNRLETLVLMAGVELPIRAIRDQIASAIHLLVHETRLPDGTRKIVAVSEITGREGETIVLQDLFRFEATGMDRDGRVIGAYRPVGTVPKFVHDLRARGVAVDLSLFKE